MNETNERKKKNRRLALVFSLFIALLVAFVFWEITVRAEHISQTRMQEKISGIILKTPLPTPKIRLEAGNGKVFSNTDLKGHWSFIFFGFSSCPYVCPTTLAQLNSMMQQLKAAGLKDNLPQIDMVSVDPDRDTAQRMHSYVTSFNPDFIGLRGSLAQTLQLAKEMKVSFAKLQAPGDDPSRYTITHTATITVIDPEGKIRAYLSYPHKAAVMAHDYQVILHSVH
jgi:protein SCO1